MNGDSYRESCCASCKAVEEVDENCSDLALSEAAELLEAAENPVVSVYGEDA